MEQPQYNILLNETDNCQSDGNSNSNDTPEHVASIRNETVVGSCVADHSFWTDEEDDFLLHEQVQLLNIEQYLHGPMSQAEADKKLQAESSDVFLVREREQTDGSVSNEYQFALSVHTPYNEIVHFRIKKLYDFWIIGGHVYKSLDYLIAVYMHRRDILPGVRLKRPLRPDSADKTLTKVIATLPYTKSENTDELTFQSGDVFIQDHRLGNGWIWATHIKSGVTGYVHERMVEDLNSPFYDPDLESLDFYHPGNRTESTELLKSRPVGTFFLRPSDQPGCSVLCVNCGGVVRKFRIMKTGERFVIGGNTFDSVREIIEHYTQRPIIDGANNVRLIIPLKKTELTSRYPSDDIYSSVRARTHQHAVSDCMDCLLHVSKAKHRWKRYRCELDMSGRNVLLYPENADRRKPKALVVLEYAHMYPLLHAAYERHHCFQLVIKDSPTDSATAYVFAAASADMRARWVEKLKPLCRCALQCNRPQLRALRSITEPGVSGSGTVKYVSTFEVTILSLNNLQQSHCKAASVNLLFNRVLITSTSRNKASDEDDKKVVWEESFIFDYFPECITEVGFYLRMKNSSLKSQTLVIPLEQVKLGSTREERLFCVGGGGSESPYLRVRVRRESHPVLQQRKDYVPLRDILLPPSGDLSSGGQLATVSALASICASEDLPYLAKCIFRLFQSQPDSLTLTSHLLTSLLLSDVEGMGQEEHGTLLRTSSIGTACLEVYYESPGPVRFVSACLKQLVQEACAQPCALELDSDRLRLQGVDSPEQTAVANGETLCRILGPCLDNLTQACSESCPPELRAVAAAVEASVTHRWPHMSGCTVSALFFLRLLCPALTTRNKFRLVFGALDDVPDPPAYVWRTLSVVAKALLLFANSQGNQATRYRDASMEKLRPVLEQRVHRFEEFNVFVTKNCPELKKEGDGSGENSEHQPEAEFSLTFQLASLHDFCAHHLEELRQRPSTPEVERLIRATEFISTKLKQL